MTTRPGWAPPDVDHTRPSVARVYDYYLGGSHNFAADREFGDQAMAAYPDLRSVVLDNRHFLRRAVLYCCSRGIGQFLDLGSGIPTAGNVHEVAQAVDPDTRVLYVDHDPVAITHSRELLGDNPFADAVAGDIRVPGDVIAAAEASGLIDLGRPLAVLMVGVLHFLGDDDEPELISRYMAATAPGSCVVLTHGRNDGKPGLLDAVRVYDQARSPNPMRMKNSAEIVAMFGDLTVVDPGVVVLPRWRPEFADDEDPDRVVDDAYPGLAGVGLVE